jgi:hypothetical protein
MDARGGFNVQILFVMLRQLKTLNAVTIYSACEKYISLNP